MGYLLLEGGAEFGGLMAEPDRLALDRAGGRDVSVRILPTAAAPDRNHTRAGANGKRWFASLGATDVETVNVIDRASANDPTLVRELRSAKLIYLLGGFPAFTAQTLADSLAWQAALDAYREGAVIAGSSAGAMILCEHFYDPYEGKLLKGLNLIPNACVLPHHKSAPHPWADDLLRQLPNVTLLGLPEQTGMIDDGSSRAWTVHGRGEVTLYRGGTIQRFKRVETFSLKRLKTQAQNPGGVN
ncbi:MAG: Type 1 glutamine amidotransferase-like domain-containing protein [Chloroflexota bacterium]